MKITRAVYVAALAIWNEDKPVSETEMTAIETQEVGTSDQGSERWRLHPVSNFWAFVVVALLSGGIGYGLFKLAPNQSDIDAQAEIASLREALDLQTAQTASNRDQIQETIEGLQAVQSELSDGLDLGDINRQLDELGGALPQIEATNQSRFDAIQSEITALSDNALDPVQLEERLAALDVALTGAQAQMAAQVQALEAQINTQIEEVRGELAQQNDRVSQVTTAALAAREAASARAAITQLTEAIQSGRPYGDALSALETSGGFEIAEILEANAANGVASLAQIQRQFSIAARAALNASLQEQTGGEAIGRVGAFLRARTGARSLNEQEGTSADAVLSQIQTRLNEADLEGALSKVTALPQSGQDALADWVGVVEVRKEALAAVAALNAQISE